MKKKRRTGVALSAALSATMLAGVLPVSGVFAAETPVVTNATVKDVDGDFDSYNIKANVTIDNGKVTALTVEPEDEKYTEDNDAYWKWATEGRTRRGTTYPGVVEQILENGGVDGVDAVSGATCTSDAIIEAVKEAIAKAAEEEKANEEPAKEEEKPAEVVDKEVYVLMNIPYADFYAAERSGTGVDAVSSATENKWKTQAGSYYQKDNEITGITYPVKTTESALKNYNKVENEEALKSAASYSYTVLESAPDFYKELKDGSFAKTSAKEATEKLDITLLTESKYGDYQINAGGEFGTVYGVIIDTKEGDSYILRHLENIWRSGQQLSWSVGVKTVESHGNTLTFENYKNIQGQTINSLTYITDKGVTKYETGDIYVPVKAADASVSVEDTDVNAENTKVNVTGLPDDFSPVYDIDEADVSLTEGAAPVKGLSIGTHTFTVKDSSGKYAPISTTFTVTTQTVPAVANDDGTALVPAEGVTQEAFEAYIKNIASVQVGEKSYNASGKRSVVIIQPDGAVDQASSALEGITEAALNVKSTGYPDVTFTYKAPAKDVYVLMNIPYSVFFGAEGAGIVDVDTVSSATNKTGNYGKAGGAFHSEATAGTDEEGNVIAAGGANGSQLKGATWAVKAASLAEVEALGGELFTDESNVTTATMGKGQTSTNLLKGYQALTEAPAYAYYVLSQAPDNYLELKDGRIVAGENAPVAESELGVEVKYGTNWGDVQLDTTDATDAANKIINAVVLTTADGKKTGLYHLDQVWAYSELGWYADVTQGLDGKTITNIRYYTSVKDDDLTDEEVPAYINYIYDYPVNIEVNSVYTGEVTAEFEDENTIALSGIPSDAVNVKAKVYHTTGGRGAVLTYLTPLTVDPSDDDIDPVTVNVVDGKIRFEADSVTNNAGTTAEFGKVLEGDNSYVIELSSDNYIIRKTSAGYEKTAANEEPQVNDPETPTDVPETPTEPITPVEDPVTPVEPVTPTEEVVKPVEPATDDPQENAEQTPVSYANTEGANAVYEAGSGKSLTFVFKRSENDDLTLSHFTGVSVDGKALSKDDYKVTEGSVSIELTPEYIATLAAGEHTLTAQFDDGEDVTVGFKIAAKDDNSKNENTSNANVTTNKNSGAANTGTAAPASTSAPATNAARTVNAAGTVAATSATAPTTGDKNNTALWAGVAIAAAGAAAGATVVRRRKKD